MIVSTQWIGGFGDIYGLNLQPVIEVARAMGIARDVEFFAKVKIFEREMLNHLRGKKKESCTEEKKKFCKAQFGEYLDWACKNCSEQSLSTEGGK